MGHGKPNGLALEWSTWKCHKSSRAKTNQPMTYEVKCWQTKTNTIDTARATERGIIDLDTIKYTNDSLILQ